MAAAVTQDQSPVRWSEEELPSFYQYDNAITSFYEIERIVHEERQSKCDKFTQPTNETLRPWAEKLYYAIQDTFSIKDVSSTRAEEQEKPPGAVLKVQQGYWKPERLHKRCWEAVMKCIESQRLRLVNPEWTTGGKVPYKKYDTWEARMDAMIEGYRESKAACKSLLDPDFIDRMADAPAAQVKAKMNNAVINAVRNEEVKHGREKINNDQHILAAKDGKDITELKRKYRADIVKRCKGEHNFVLAEQDNIEPSYSEAEDQNRSIKRRQILKPVGLLRSRAISKIKKATSESAVTDTSDNFEQSAESDDMMSQWFDVEKMPQERVRHSVYPYENDEYHSLDQNYATKPPANPQKDYGHYRSNFIISQSRFGKSSIDETSENSPQLIDPEILRISIPHNNTSRRVNSLHHSLPTDDALDGNENLENLFPEWNLPMQPSSFDHHPSEMQVSDSSSNLPASRLSQPSLKLPAQRFADPFEEYASGSMNVGNTNNEYANDFMQAGFNEFNEFNDSSEEHDFETLFGGN